MSNGTDSWTDAPMWKTRPNHAQTRRQMTKIEHPMRPCSMHAMMSRGMRGRAVVAVAAGADIADAVAGSDVVLRCISIIPPLRASSWMMEKQGLTGWLMAASFPALVPITARLPRALLGSTPSRRLCLRLSLGLGLVHELLCLLLLMVVLEMLLWGRHRVLLRIYLSFVRKQQRHWVELELLHLVLFLCYCRCRSRSARRRGRRGCASTAARRGPGDRGPVNLHLVFVVNVVGAVPSDGCPLSNRFVSFRALRDDR